MILASKSRNEIAIVRRISSPSPECLMMHMI